MMFALIRVSILFCLLTVLLAASSKLGVTVEEDSPGTQRKRALTSAPKPHNLLIQEIPDRKLTTSSSSNLARSQLISRHFPSRDQQFQASISSFNLHSKPSDELADNLIRMNVINSLKALDSHLGTFFPLECKNKSLMKLHLEALRIAKTEITRQSGPLHPLAIKYSIIYYEIGRVVEILQKYNTNPLDIETSGQFCSTLIGLIMDFMKNVSTAINFSGKTPISKLLIPTINGIDLAKEANAFYAAMEAFDFDLTLQCGFAISNMSSVDRIGDMMHSYLALAFDYESLKN